MPHPPEESTYFLADRFHPGTLYAFDGYHGFREGVESYKKTMIIRRRKAAWTSTGYQPYRDAGMCSAVVEEAEDDVRTFNLAEFILHLGESVILKLDCEGAEYVLLPHLHALFEDEWIDLLLIEWHPAHLANGWYLPPEERPRLRCHVQDWNDLTGLETEAERSDPSTA